jgi:two-component system sensor histidine kinase TctE
MISLRRKLLFRLLTPLLPLLLLGVVAAFYMANHFANLAFDRSLFRAALALADQVEVVAGEVTVDLPQAAFDMLEYDKEDWIYYKVTGARGEFVTGYAELPAPPIAKPVPGQHYYYTTRFDDKEISVAAFYLSLKGTSANGVALVQVGETTSKRKRMVNEIILGMALPQLLMVLIAGLMVWRGVGRGLVPLDKLRDEITSRSHRDLAPLSLADSPREVRPMVEAMNDLMSRLEQTIAQQQRFVADASHQLRTPLAGLKTQAEIALREQQDPEQVRHALQQILASSDSLSHLIAQLLTLARIDPEAVDLLPLEPLNLESLAREITSSWVPAALGKEIDLGFESEPGEYMVSGDAILLREMIVNLIDNAIRYSPAGGCVTVKLSHANNGIELCVEDNGPGIPQEKRERVFERFYRILGTGQEGCGLGLAIVREIATRHGAVVRVEDGSEGKGVRMCVVFPPCPEQA